MAILQHNDAEKAVCERVRKAFEFAEKPHKGLRDRWDHFNNLYRSYQNLRSHWVQNPGDRGALVYDAKREWGAELFIPYVFSTIETIVPRAVSQQPRMLILPGDAQSEKNLDAVKLLIGEQQSRINYELVLQRVLRSGLIGGLGVQKTFWRHKTATWQGPAPATLPGTLEGAGRYVEGQPQEVTTFRGPVATWVDPHDWLWDPLGYDMETIRYAIHRTWRDDQYVLRMLQQHGDQAAPWDSRLAQALTAEDVAGLASGASRYQDILKGRSQASGTSELDLAGESIHEVWEFHDGEEIITILDRQLVVAQRPNFLLGEMPFQIYRPTEVGGELAGISEVEPIEHLQLELNTSRSQRRDAVTLKLAPTYGYDTGIVDASDIVFQPHGLIGVNGDPNQALKQFTLGDIPGSAFTESAEIKEDIQRATGVDDTVAGSGTGAAETATGVQLVQAAANIRIQNKSLRLQVETIRPASRMFYWLNRRNLLEPTPVRVPSETGEESWQYLHVGQEQLQGHFEFDGGSPLPENTPQMRQDAQMKWNMLGNNPLVDQRALLTDVLHDLGYKHPETMLVAPNAIPPSVLDRVASMSTDPRIRQIIDLAVQQAHAEEPAQGQQPTDAPAVAA